MVDITNTTEENGQKHEVYQVRVQYKTFPIW